MKESNYRIDRSIILLFLIFSCISTYFAHNINVAYSFGQAPIVSTGSISNDDVSMLGGAFAPLVGIGGSPFIALSMLSVNKKAVRNFICKKSNSSAQRSIKQR